MKRKDPASDLWITDDDEWTGRWAVYECVCSKGHRWNEVMPEYANPDVCPKCGDMIVDDGPDVQAIVQQ